MSYGDTGRIRAWCERIRDGEPPALEELLIHFERRLLGLTRKMLRGYPSVSRWEETADVFQLASLRLRRAIAELPPRNTRELLGMASLQIRRELLNLARQHRRRVGESRLTRAPAGTACDVAGSTTGCGPDDDDGPDQLAEWTEFHEIAHTLPENLRDVFDLLWYQGLTHVEAARVLGICERTVRTRWQQARLAVSDAMQGQLPGR